MALLINAHPDGRARGVADDLMAETARVDSQLSSGAEPGVVLTLDQSRRQMRALATLAAANYQRPAMETVDRQVPTSFGHALVRTYAPNSTGTMILLVHGGGWVAGDIETHDPIARWLAAEAGASVAVVEYSLAPEHPYPRGVTEVADVIRALAVEIDPQRRFVVMGDSAGANLGAMALLHLSDAERAQVDGFISLYGPYVPSLNLSSHRLYGDGSFGLSAAEMHSCWSRYAGELLAERADDLTPLGKDLSRFPPTLCIGAEYDVLLDDTVALYSSLASAGVDVSLAIWSGLTHGCLHYVGAVDSVTRAARSMLPFINGEKLPPAPSASGASADAEIAPSSGSPVLAAAGRRSRASLANILGRQILRGELKPGQLLPTEEKASAAMGVSRSAYREAIKTLSAKGLISSQPKIGTKISPRSSWNILDPDLLAWTFEAEPDEKFIRNLFELRNTVEPTAAAMAADRATEEDMANLTKALSGIVAALPGSMASLEALADFHRLVLLSSKNEALGALWPAIELTLRWSVRLQNMLPRHHVLEPTIAAHSLVLDHIASRHGPAAQDAMNALIRSSFDDTIANLRQIRRMTETTIV
jgi:DNA-binding FadR family transcriptional regulator/acetyl esterase/lipase